jgi:hypothetical protein
MTESSNLLLCRKSVPTSTMLHRALREYLPNGASRIGLLVLRISQKARWLLPSERRASLGADPSIGSSQSMDNYADVGGSRCSVIIIIHMISPTTRPSSVSIGRLAISGLVIDYCGTVMGIRPVSTSRDVVWSPFLLIGAAFRTVQQLIQKYGL